MSGCTPIPHMWRGDSRGFSQVNPPCCWGGGHSTVDECTKMWDEIAM